VPEGVPNLAFAAVNGKIMEKGSNPMGNDQDAPKHIQAQIEELQEQLSALEAADSPKILLQTVREKNHPTGEPTSPDWQS
jgi:hypothetical protein